MIYGHHDNKPKEGSDEPFIGGTPSKSGWTDVAAIVILTPKKETKHHVVWSDHIAIPSDAVKECLPPSGSEDAAQGKEVTALQTWSELKDPHSDLTGFFFFAKAFLSIIFFSHEKCLFSGGLRPRAAFLSDAIQGWVKSNMI